MNKMKLKTTMTGAPLLLAGLLAMNTQAGTLDPELEAAIADMSPGSRVPAWVFMASNPARSRGAPVIVVLSFILFIA